VRPLDRRGARSNTAHPLIADETIAEIRDRTDIVAVIGEYVDLKQRGQNWVGLCPFHNEKSPSFNVRRDRQFFHCFGCKESGDALAFLMRLEGLSFPQAARSLAERAGIEIPDREQGQDDESRRERVRIERLCAVMEAAAVFYFEARRRHAASRYAQEELVRRAITDKTADTFRLGYAPHGWDALTAHLSAKGYSLPDAELLGLCVRRREGDGYYDRFRHRLVFPIADLHGRVVAFSGRILPPPEGREPATQEPKYVNSPESPLYKKGELLFGLHQARVEIRRNGWAVLCEGNFDLVSLHQAGVQNVVAPLGTAFTEAQARLLRRFAQRVTLMFDGDTAGRKAVQAAYPLLLKTELAGRVAALPTGQDPDAFIRAQGPEGLTRLIDGSTGIVEYLIDAAAEVGGTAAGERASAIANLGPVIGAAKNPVEIELYIERVAQRFGIADLRAVREQLRRGYRAAAPGAATASAKTGQPKVAEKAEPVKMPPRRQLDLLGALLDKPALFSSVYAGNLKELLTTEETQSIFSAAAGLVDPQGNLDASRLLASVEGNLLVGWLHERLSVEHYADPGEAEKVLQAGIPLLAKQNIEGELPVLADAIRRARQSGDEELAITLTKQRDALAASAHRLIRGLKR
jgi:DNA primase